VLILPEATLHAVHVSASVCAQGEIDHAVLYATWRWKALTRQCGWRSD
jgi:hypothetical protein